MFRRSFWKYVCRRKLLGNCHPFQSAFAKERLSRVDPKKALRRCLERLARVAGRFCVGSARCRRNRESRVIGQQFERFNAELSSMKAIDISYRIRIKRAWTEEGKLEKKEASQLGGNLTIKWIHSKRLASSCANGLKWRDTQRHSLGTFSLVSAATSA